MNAFAGLECAEPPMPTPVLPLEDLPDWLPAWCLDHLGGEPADVLFQLHQVSMVFGLRLPGGKDVVVKARADDGRAASCVAAQAWLAERGFPCPRPLTPVTSAGPPALAPVESSEAFLVAYQNIRGRLFTAVELQVAWAASLWMAAHNAREEALRGNTPVGGVALRAQAAERLRRANA